MDYFAGKLNGYTAKELGNMIDYSKETYEDRKEVVDSIINTGFFDEYFNGYYDSYKKSSSCLTDGNNICRLLERLGTYLLNAKDVEDGINTYDTDSLVKKINKEENLESIAEGSDINVIVHNLKKNEVGTIAKNKTFKLSEMNDDEFKYRYNLLDDYEKNIVDKYISMYYNVNISNLNKFQKDRQKFRIKQDIETILQGDITIKHNNLDITSDMCYYDNVDIKPDDIKHRHILTGLSYKTNSTRIERDGGILFNEIEVEEDLNNDLYLTKLELESIIKRVGLSDVENKVLKLTRKGLTVREISDMINISIGMVSTHKKNIVDKIMEEVN